MKINNIDMDKAKEFVKEVSSDPSKAKKTKKIIGHWNFEAGKPQFEANLEFAAGQEVVYADQAPFLGGGGLSPDPVQYCLFGLAACYAATFASIASLEEIYLKELKVTAENQIDLSKALGLSEYPIVESVTITVEVKSENTLDQLKKLDEISRNRCPGVFCLTNPISLKTEIKKI